jgi:hypothetical protein
VYRAITRSVPFSASLLLEILGSVLMPLLELLAVALYLPMLVDAER